MGIEVLSVCISLKTRALRSVFSRAFHRENGAPENCVPENLKTEGQAMVVSLMELQGNLSIHEVMTSDQRPSMKNLFEDK